MIGCGGAADETASHLPIVPLGPGSPAPTPAATQYCLQQTGTTSISAHGGCQLTGFPTLVFSIPSATTLSWGDANQYCEELSQGGYTDWTLPTLSDIRSAGAVGDTHSNHAIYPIGATQSAYGYPVWLISGVYTYQGGNNQYSPEASTLGLALCVRHPSL